MSTNTNNFNYYSDYQGHGGVHIVIVLLLFLGLLVFGSNISNDNSINNDIDNSYYDNDSVDNSINDDFDNQYDDSDSSNINNSNGKMFEYYKG